MVRILRADRRNLLIMFQNPTFRSGLILFVMVVATFAIVHVWNERFGHSGRPAPTVPPAHGFEYDPSLYLSNVDSNYFETGEPNRDAKIDEAVAFIREKLASYHRYSRVDVDLDRKTGLMKLDFYFTGGKLAYKYEIDLKSADPTRLALKDNFSRSSYVNTYLFLNDNGGHLRENGIPTTKLLFEFETSDYATRTGTALKTLILSFGGPEPDATQLNSKLDLIAFIEKRGHKSYADFQLDIQDPEGITTLHAGNQVLEFKLRDLDYDHAGPDEMAPSLSSTKWRLKTINLKRAIVYSPVKNPNYTEVGNTFALQFETQTDAREFVEALKKLAIRYGWKAEPY